jgi:hypothetical protein
MTRNQIVQALFTGRNFNECIGKMEPAHLRDDLKQEVILVVCEWPDEKVIKLHSDGVLDFFVARVIINHIQSTGIKGKNSFYNKYRRTYVEMEKELAAEVESVEDRETKEALEDVALSNIDRLYWYDAEMLRLYMELGNYRAIQKHTGIPFVSCYKNIQKSIVALRNMVVGENKPVFSKDELRQAQDDTPKLKLDL